jgi:predicted signal transduction protein with EAL and GGDEF domain
MGAGSHSPASRRLVACVPAARGFPTPRNSVKLVVAEGVEDLAVWNMLRSLGCDDAQGYFMSRPLEPRALATWIRGNEGRFTSAAVAAMAVKATR